MICIASLPGIIQIYFLSKFYIMFVIDYAIFPEMILNIHLCCTNIQK